MSRKEYLKRREQEQAEAKAEFEAREKAFDAAVKANPDLYKKLKGALWNARDTYSQIDTQYRNLSNAHAAAMNLKWALEECKLDAELHVATGMLASLDRQMQPILEPKMKAAEALEIAQNALNEQFPNPDLS